MYDDPNKLSDAEQFWTGDHWPKFDPAGYEFLGRALQRLGRAMFDTWSDTDPREAFQLMLAKKRESTTPPPITRVSRVQHEIIRGAEAQEFETAFLARSGRVHALPPHLWNRPRSASWFFLCLINPRQLESDAIDGPDHCLIFVSRPDLDRFIRDKVWLLDDDARDRRRLIRQGQVLEPTATTVAPQIATAPEPLPAPATDPARTAQQRRKPWSQKAERQALDWCATTTKEGVPPSRKEFFAYAMDRDGLNLSRATAERILAKVPGEHRRVAGYPGTLRA